MKRKNDSPRPLPPSVTEEFRSELLGERYWRIRHGSGLEIYVFPKCFSGIYAILGVGCGAMDSEFRLGEDGPYTKVPDGIAHFLEHKMFENPNGSDAFEDFAGNGASANAYTSDDMTAYLFSCTEQFEESLGILLDMITHPHFTMQSVRREKKIIAQEIRSGMDSPYTALHYALMEAMYHEHPVRLNVAGSEESIARITPELLYRCHDAFYNLRNMKLVVCGNVTPETVTAVADSHLREVPAFTAQRKPVSEPDAPAAPRVVRTMSVARPLFAIGVKDTAISADPLERMRKKCIVDILDDIFFSQSSPFRNSLYEDGLIPAQLSYNFMHCPTYSYHILTGESPDPDEVLRRYSAFLADSIRNGVDPAAFERCRRGLYADAVDLYDDTSDIAQALLDSVLAGESLFEEAEIIRSLRVEDAEHVLRELFDEKQTVLAVLEPERSARPAAGTAPFQSKETEEVPV